MNALIHRHRRLLSAAAVFGVLVIIGIAITLTGRRQVTTTTYSHQQGGVIWQRVDHYQSYSRPLSLRGLLISAQQAISTRSLPQWRSRIEVRYILLEPVSGAPPDVLDHMADFMSRLFASGLEDSSEIDFRSGESLIEGALAQLDARRKASPNQSDYRDFRTMKVLHESAQYIVLQVALERELAPIGPGPASGLRVNTAFTAAVYDKQTGHSAPFPEGWSPATGPTIPELLARSNGLGGRPAITSE